MDMSWELYCIHMNRTDVMIEPITQSIKIFSFKMIGNKSIIKFKFFHFHILWLNGSFLDEMLDNCRNPIRGNVVISAFRHALHAPYRGLKGSKNTCINQFFIKPESIANTIGIKILYSITHLFEEGPWMTYFACFAA